MVFTNARNSLFKRFYFSDSLKKFLIIFFLSILSFCILFIFIEKPKYVRWAISIFIIFFITSLSIYKVEYGIIAFFTYLVYKGFIRRYCLNFYFGWPKFDPFHLVDEAIIWFLALNLTFSKKREILESIKKNKTVRLCAILLVWMFLQLFNPIQGNIFGGFIGGMRYYIDIFLWFFVGYFYLGRNEKFTDKIKWFFIINTIIVALYGLKQQFKGFSKIEWIWLKNFPSTTAVYLGVKPRPFSTFIAPSDYGNFLIVAFILFLFYFVRTKKVGYLLIALLSLWAKLVEGARGWVFISIWAIGILLILHISRKINILKLFTSFIIILFLSRILIIPYIVVPILKIIPSSIMPDPVRFEHMIRGLERPFNPKYSTLHFRIMGWKTALKTSLKFPFGLGLGNASIISKKFSTQWIGAGENHYLEFLLATGWIGLIILLIVIIRNFENLIILWKNKSNHDKILPILVVNTIIFIPTTSTLWGVPPLSHLNWTLVGWLTKFYEKLNEAVLYDSQKFQKD